MNSNFAPLVFSSLIYRNTGWNHLIFVFGLAFKTIIDDIAQVQLVETLVNDLVIAHGGVLVVLHGSVAKELIVLSLLL